MQHKIDIKYKMHVSSQFQMKLIMDIFL